MKVTCFICGHRTLDERCDWDICPVCLWEDDVLVTDNEDVKSPANKGMLVSEAQANFMMYGASTKERQGRARVAGPDEPFDPDWKPLPEALSKVDVHRNRSEDTRTT